jgi:N-acetylglucosaminyl-diphospho-decaprenol L-rhamnosyltransferase
MLPAGHSRSALGARPIDQPDREGVSVVIVTYHSAPVIEQCLRAVAEGAPDVPMEVIVVDNASADDTIAIARAAAPLARFIEQDRNGGFADGCAAGARVASGRWLLFLNPDTVIAAGAIKALLDCAADRPAAGIVGGRFVHEDGSVDPRSWWGRPSLWSALCFALCLNTLLPGSRVFDPETPRPWSADLKEVRAVPVVSGACMLVQQELWEQLGGFDKQYFLYGEDADFCLRAAKAGCQPVVTARAECRHIGGKSSASGSQKLILLFTGKCTVARGHFPRGTRGIGVRLLLTGVFVRATASRWHSVSPARQQRPTALSEDWRVLWARRREWRRGWTPTDQRLLLSSRSQVE